MKNVTVYLNEHNNYVFDKPENENCKGLAAKYISTLNKPYLSGLFRTEKYELADVEPKQYIYKPIEKLLHFYRRGDMVELPNGCRLLTKNCKSETIGLGTNIDDNVNLAYINHKDQFDVIDYFTYTLPSTKLYINDIKIGMLVELPNKYIRLHVVRVDTEANVVYLAVLNTKNEQPEPYINTFSVNLNDFENNFLYHIDSSYAIDTNPTIEKLYNLYGLDVVYDSIRKIFCYNKVIKNIDLEIKYYVDSNIFHYTFDIYNQNFMEYTDSFHASAMDKFCNSDIENNHTSFIKNAKTINGNIVTYYESNE